MTLSGQQPLWATFAAGAPGKLPVELEARLQDVTS
jgi:hypothetical protein